MLFVYRPQLYQISREAQKEFNTGARVEMVSYDASLGFSHNKIYLDPNLSDVVR